MEKLLKRTISFLLAFAMVCAMLPAIGVYAAELVGYLDVWSAAEPGKICISGWAMNQTDKSTVEIHVYVKDTAGNVITSKNFGKTNVLRPDVCIAYGKEDTFGYDICIDVKQNGTPYYGKVTLEVYAVSGNNILLGAKQLLVREPASTYGENDWLLSAHDGCREKPDGVYRIASAANPSYSLAIENGGLRDENGNLTNGALLQLASNLETDAQLFHLRRIHCDDLTTDNGTNETRTIVSFMNINSQRFVDLDSNTETKVHEYGTLPDTENRQWVMHNNGDGTYSFESIFKSGFYLTISGGSIQSGVNMTVATAGSDDKPTLYQKFYLNAEYVHGDRIGGFAGYLKSGQYRLWNATAASNTDTYVMDISGATTTEGGVVQIWEPADDKYDLNGNRISFIPQQVFDIQKDSEGWYTIRNINSGLYIAAYEDATDSSTGYCVRQRHVSDDSAKWAFVPIVRGDGASVSYWIVNKATGLYLFHFSIQNGVPIVLSSLNNMEGSQSYCLYWGAEQCQGAGAVNSVTNDTTGVAVGQFDTSDTISLPIKIYDYLADGMLFEYFSAAFNNNAAFSFVGQSNNGYTSWPIGQNTSGNDVFSNETTFLTGENALWIPYADNNIYVVNQEQLADAKYGGTIDLEYLGKHLGYSIYGEMTSGSATMGLLNTTLREVDGHKLPEYNDEVVAYLADLLDKTLESSVQITHQEAILPAGHEDDIAALLLTQLRASCGGTLAHYSSEVNTRRDQINMCLQTTYQQKDDLIGTWDQCKDNIHSYTDAAYFLLNNLFYPNSYNIPQDKFDYLVLSKATLTNGKTAYVFDSGFSDTYCYTLGTQSAVKYDFDAKTISNTSMMGKPCYRFLFETGLAPYYAFLPIWNGDGTQNNTPHPYSGELENLGDPNGYKGKNYNYVLQCNGMFTYHENDDLFFDFAGDDDVYLFINGQLVLDLGGAHSPATLNINVNDYVYDARAKVAAGTATDRDRALALVDGEEYSFDFYYMERHSPGANLRIATNIRVSDPNLDTDKKAYQNGQELNNGGLVNADENIEYSFEVGNPKDSIATLYRLSFTDAKLGITIDADNGLTVNNSKTVNKEGNPLTAADLKIYFTNQQGTTQEIIMGGSDAAEKNASLKVYLKEVNGHGLLPGCRIEIRGIYYNIENSDFTNGRFTNTLYVTANQNVDNSGDTYQDSVNMVICSASGPQYYQWSGHSLTVTKEKFTSDVKALLKGNSPLLEQIAPATSLGAVKKLEICDMMGNLISSNVATASDDGLSIHYGKPGTYVFYVKVTQEDNSTIVIPVQVYVVEVQDSVFVLDYGLKVKFGDLLTAKDTLSVAGKTTSYTIEAMTGTAPTYENNHIVFSNGAQSVDGTYGRYLLTDDDIEYHPDQFMEGADSIYVAVRVSEGTPGQTIGEVNINTEVEMYKKITIVPANVVYYEDDFPAISYSKAFTNDGVGSGDLYQSADQSGQYGYDDAYESGTTHSGSSAHAIQIRDKENVVEFTFNGTGFELIGRCNDTDNCVIIVEVRNSNNDLVKRIPVILEYDNKAITNDEGIYQVPIVRVDNLAHGEYTVQIRGVPVYLKNDQDEYVKDDQGNYVINTTNPPILYVDGLRIYNPLSLDTSDRDHYLDGEDTADFLEIRDLILEGKAVVIGFNDDDYSITTGTSIFTENRNEKLYPVNTFTINSVAHGNYFAYVLASTNNQEPALTLHTKATELGMNQFKFTFAKTENNTNYYYIHINCGGSERYLKKSNGDNSVMLISADSLDEDAFFWEVSYLSVAGGIVTIRNKLDGSYLSASSVDTAAKKGELLALKVDTITNAQKWELGSVPATTVFEGNAVSSVNDYLVFGPNNELYLDGKTTSQALVFYFTPDEKPETTTMLQVGVHVLNDNRLFGSDGELTTPGCLYQGANTGIVGYKEMDKSIQSSTERYYIIDLSICKYDELNNRYEVVLYCKDGYLSFTNLKVSGGTISSVNGEVADLRYNNGVLEMLSTVGVSETKTWVAVSNPEEYVDFQSISRQMSATVMYEPDVDTGEFVPALPDDEEGGNEEDEEEKEQVKINLFGRSLLFKDIIKMRFYFDISATGVTSVTPENSGLLVWTEEEYAALERYTADTAGERIRGLTKSVNGCYADTKGIPAKNMVDRLYVRAYVILPDGSYVYSEVTQFSPVMYAQLILEKEDASESMKELVIALMNYGAAAQLYFGYKTDHLMNDWLTDEQKDYSWSDDMINVLPEDVSKYQFATDERIQWRGSSVTFTGAVNQNFYFDIPEELLRGALKAELLYWTESDYNALPELTVENAKKVDFNVTDGRAVIEGTPAKALGNAFYFAVRVVYEDGEIFSQIRVDSAHDYTRRVLSSSVTSDAMKELAKALVYYSCKAKKQLGG